MSSSSSDIPDCVYPSHGPTLVPPKLPTPKHSIYLTNLDDQKFLRFTIKHLYVYKKSVPVDALKSSLSRVLVDYYPLAGRIRASDENPAEKLQIDCNGEGVLFVEALLDFTVDKFLQLYGTKPHPSWKKLHYREQGQNFLSTPPLVLQVTYLRCGGMIVCAAFSHCMADGFGSSRFLNSWGYMTANPDATQVPVAPVHSREILRPRTPPQITKRHPEYTVTEGSAMVGPLVDPRTEVVVPTSYTFSLTQIVEIKRLPSVECTSFEALASHVWRAWVRALGPPPSLTVKLLFAAGVRSTLRPKLPEGYYGNSFVMACAEATAAELVAGSGLRHGVERVQAAKRALDDDYVRSMIDLLEDRRPFPDLTATLVISQSAKLGLENVDFGDGKPLHMGPLTSEIHCLLAPVAGVPEAVTSVMSVPESVVGKFEFCMRDF